MKTVCINGNLLTCLANQSRSWRCFKIHSMISVIVQTKIMHNTMMLCWLNFDLTLLRPTLADNVLLLCLLAVRAPGGLVVLSMTGNLTVCWSSPPDDPPDGYYITSHPLIYPTPTSLWINRSSPDAHWVNESVCVNLGAFTPGQTYEVGVVSLKGQDRSKRTSIIHTTGKRNESTAFKG